MQKWYIPSESVYFSHTKYPQSAQVMKNHVHKGRERKEVLGPKEVGSVTARVWSQEG